MGNIVSPHNVLVSTTPFRDTARKIAKENDYIEMQVGCDSARSHAWWRNLVHYGAWNGPGTVRVGPPGPDTLPGIAKLFETSEEQVARMIAADWYGVFPETELSPRVQRLGPLFERLSEGDAELVERLARRLASAAKHGIAAA